MDATTPASTVATAEAPAYPTYAPYVPYVYTPRFFRGERLVGGVFVALVAVAALIMGSFWVNAHVIQPANDRVTEYVNTPHRTASCGVSWTPKGPGHDQWGEWGFRVDCE